MKKSRITVMKFDPYIYSVLMINRGNGILIVFRLSKVFIANFANLVRLLP